VQSAHRARNQGNQRGTPLPNTYQAAVSRRSALTVTCLCLLARLMLEQQQQADAAEREEAARRERETAQLEQVGTRN
jgi:hypothetical protein